MISWAPGLYIDGYFPRTFSKDTFTGNLSISKFKYLGILPKTRPAGQAKALGKQYAGGRRPGLRRKPEDGQAGAWRVLWWGE